MSVKCLHISISDLVSEPNCICCYSRHRCVNSDNSDYQWADHSNSNNSYHCSEPISFETSRFEMRKVFGHDLQYFLLGKFVMHNAHAQSVTNREQNFFSGRTALRIWGQRGVPILNFQTTWRIFLTPNKNKTWALSQSKTFMSEKSI